MDLERRGSFETTHWAACISTGGLVRLVVVHLFNPSSQEAEAGGALSLRPAWSTELVPGHPELHSEPCLGKTDKQVPAGEG